MHSLITNHCRKNNAKLQIDTSSGLCQTPLVHLMLTYFLYIEISSSSLYLFYFTLLIFLSYNWHIILLVSVVQHDSIFVYDVKWSPKLSLITLHHKKKIVIKIVFFFFLVMRTIFVTIFLWLPSGNLQSVLYLWVCFGGRISLFFRA